MVATVACTSGSTMAQSRIATHSLLLTDSALPHLSGGLSRSAGAACCSSREYSKAVEHVEPDISRKLEPYSKTKRPQSWPQIRLRLAENATRNRPITKNRMHWDRRMEKQVQIAVRCPATCSPCIFTRPELFYGALQIDVCRRTRGSGGRTPGGANSGSAS